MHCSAWIDASPIMCIIYNYKKNILNPILWEKWNRMALLRNIITKEQNSYCKCVIIKNIFCVFLAIHNNSIHTEKIIHTIMHIGFRRLRGKPIHSTASTYCLLGSWLKGEDWSHYSSHSVGKVIVATVVVMLLYLALNGEDVVIPRVEYNLHKEVLSWIL